MRQNTKAHIFLVLAILMGAMVPVALKLGTDMGIPEFLLLVAIISTLTTFLFALLAGKIGQIRKYLSNPRDLLLLSSIGILQYAMWGYGFLYAEKFISVSLAAVIYRTFPLLMLLFIPYFLREKVTKFQVIALALGFAGLYLALSGGNLLLEGLSNTPIIGLMVLVALSSAFTSVLIKKYVFEISSSMFIFSLANLVLFGLIFVFTHSAMAPVNIGEILGIAYMGIVGNAILGIVYYSALRALKTTFVTNLYFLSPFMTFVYSAVIFGEVIEPYYILIALLVGVGLVIQKFDVKGGKYIATKPEGHVFFDITSAFIESKDTQIQEIIKNGGKVLGIKIGGGLRQKLEEEISRAEGKSTLIFTHLHERVIREEREFLEQIMGIEQGEIVLIGAGEAEESEKELSQVAQRTQTKELIY